MRVWITDHRSKISYEGEGSIRVMDERLEVQLSKDGYPIIFDYGSPQSQGGIFVRGLLPDCIAIWWDGRIQLSTGPDAKVLRGATSQPPSDI